ncbi:response regulator [Nocardioides sp. MAHUQ-72]|uniref:response regulator n=1 Tax=unclassified Nocardioides TaxID=2615069 RepID=UPI0036244E8E
MSASGRAKILMVDDRPENLMALEAILGSLDLDLVRASSGDEALRALLRDEFALILLDAQMPGMDGFETATRIKRRTRTKDVPIIFLTAVDKDLSSSYRGYVAGGADYLSKPFDPWILRAKVQVFVDLWQAGRVQAEQAAMLRDRVGVDPARDADVRDRLGRLQEALHALESDLADTSSAGSASLARVRHEVEALRSTLIGESADLRGTRSPAVPSGSPD